MMVLKPSLGPHTCSDTRCLGRGHPEPALRAAGLTPHSFHPQGWPQSCVHRVSHPGSALKAGHDPQAAPAPEGRLPAATCPESARAGLCLWVPSPSPDMPGWQLEAAPGCGREENLVPKPGALCPVKVGRGIPVSHWGHQGAFSREAWACWAGEARGRGWSEVSSTGGAPWMWPEACEVPTPGQGTSGHSPQIQGGLACPDLSPHHVQGLMVLWGPAFHVRPLCP